MGSAGNSWPTACPRPPSPRLICWVMAGHRGRPRGPSMPMCRRWPHWSMNRPTDRLWWSDTRSAVLSPCGCRWSVPDLIAALVLLDPAVGLDGSRVREVVDGMVAFPDYAHPAAARAEKATGAWADVDPAVLDAELAEHLIALPSGRYSWRMSLPAMVCYWSELAREIVLPPAGTPTTLVRAGRADPRYVSDELVAALRQRLGVDLVLHEFDCGHMVPQAKPAEVAALIRQHLATPSPWHR